ncbi:MAG: hypothetical protein ACI4TA_02920 [Acetatifactor sp.]
MELILMPIVFAFIVLPIIVIAIVCTCNGLNKEKIKILQAEENSKAIKEEENTKWDSYQIERRFYNNLLNAYIHRQFNNVSRWHILSSNGKEIHVKILRKDGTEISPVICASKLDTEIFSVREKKESVPDLTKIANEWLEKWKDFLMEKENSGEGFSINKSDLPADKAVLEMILDRLSEIGFMVQEEETLVRCIY